MSHIKILATASVSRTTSLSLTLQQAPSDSLVAHSYNVPAETKLATAPKSPPKGLQQVLADTFEPDSRNVVVDDAQGARTRHSNSGKGQSLWRWLLRGRAAIDAPLQ